MTVLKCVWMVCSSVGLAACTVSTIGAVLLHVNGVINLEYIYDHYLQFITASILVSTLLSIYLYASSFTGNKILAAGGNSGKLIAPNPVVDNVITSDPPHHPLNDFPCAPLA